MSDDASSRWDAFLAKIRQRGEETLAQAAEGCEALLDLNALDPQPMTVAWMAIENQLHELTQRIDETWSAKVEPALEAAGVPTEREHRKAVQLRGELERLKEEVELRVFGDAAQRIYEQAKVNLAKDQRCAQCGAPLQPGQAFFRSRHLACAHCGSVNTFVPGALITAVEHFCCHHLARRKTVALWRAWLAVEHADRATAERALRDYTTAYLRARIELVPEYEKDFEKDLQGRMAFFAERQEDT